MIKLLLLLVFLTVILLISVMTSSGSILNPQVLFISGFTLSIGYAFFYIKEMQLDLCTETFFVLFAGIFTFFIVSILCQKIGAIREKKVINADSVRGFFQNGDNNRVNVDFWKFIVFLMINMLSVVLFVRYLRAFSGKNNISEAIRYFDYAKKFTAQNVDVPGLVSVLRMASAVIMYICIYLLAHQLIYHYKQNRLLIYLNILISCINTILSGGRSGILEFIFGFFVMAYFIYKAKYDYKKKIPSKVVIFILLAVLLAVPVFYLSAALMGRGKQTDIFHYICIYLSGEIKNLDIFIRKGIFGTDISKSQTLISLRLTILPKLGITGWSSKLDLPFVHVDGFGTGNVYTIFYMFMYDGGYPALFFYTIMMALIASLSYRYVISTRYKKYYGAVNIPLIIYSQIAFSVLFSFFSDRFYELIFNLEFWRKSIILIVLVWFINRVKITNSNETVMEIKKKEFVLFRNIYGLRGSDKGEIKNEVL